MGDCDLQVHVVEKSRWDGGHGFVYSVMPSLIAPFAERIDRLGKQLFWISYRCLKPGIRSCVDIEHRHPSNAQEIP